MVPLNQHEKKSSYLKNMENLWLLGKTFQLEIQFPLQDVVFTHCITHIHLKSKKKH
jgi:hypothetical protein